MECPINSTALLYDRLGVASRSHQLDVSIFDLSLFLTVRTLSRVSNRNDCYVIMPNLREEDLSISNLYPSSRYGSVAVALVKPKPTENV